MFLIAFLFLHLCFSVKSFVVHLYRHIREKNVYEIHQIYENSFQAISERFFKESPWPSVDAVAHYMDNDHVVCLLYREMWFRHLYARLTPTLHQRIVSWDKYCSLFQVVLHGVVNMQLPNQWLWDMVNEFVYQFQSFCQFRAKMKSKTPEEVALLRQFDQAWNVYGVLNFLQALVEKSAIIQILEQEKEGLEQAGLPWPGIRNLQWRGGTTQPFAKMNLGSTLSVFWILNQTTTMLVYMERVFQ